MKLIIKGSYKNHEEYEKKHEIFSKGIQKIQSKYDFIITGVLETSNEHEVALIESVTEPYPIEIANELRSLFNAVWRE
jgi:hypothetical protein